MDQRDFHTVQCIAFATKIGQPQHRAVGHGGQLGGQPVELGRETALIIRQPGRRDQPGIEDLAAQIGGLQQGDKARAGLCADGLQSLTGKQQGALPWPQLGDDPAPQTGLFIQLPQRRLLRRLPSIYVATGQAVAGGDPVLHQQQLLLVLDHADGRRRGGKEGL